MNIVLFGSRGRVGEKIKETLIRQGHQLSCPVREQLDLSDIPAVENYLAELEIKRPQALINSAAISGLEACLDDPVTAHYVNVMAPECMARFCERTGTRFIHLSTDYVLDGRFPGKKEESGKCKPVNTYGESKWEAEIRIAEAHSQAIIARVSWVYGNTRHPAFPDVFLAKAVRGEPLTAIDDKWSLPTHTDTITEAVTAFLRHPEASGIYHVCDSGQPANWHDYAVTVLAQAEQQGLTLVTKTVSTQKMKEITFFRDPRPKHTAMDNQKLSRLLGYPIPDWQTRLSEYLFSLSAQ